MTEHLVLVVGANGNTGSAAIDNLVQRGVRVRALVQTDDERASRLTPATSIRRSSIR
jgi:NAD(P)H dehydrogenase (quinone)